MAMHKHILLLSSPLVDPSNGLIEVIDDRIVRQILNWHYLMSLYICSNGNSLIRASLR